MTDVHLKVLFVKCCVCSEVESLRLKVNTVNKLEVFEMWIYNRMFKISWNQRMAARRCWDQWIKLGN